MQIIDFEEWAIFTQVGKLQKIILGVIVWIEKWRETTQQS